MAFTTNPYCDLQQVKDGLDLQSAKDDNWIQRDLIPTANIVIDRYCGRTWQTDGTTQSPATRKYSGTGKASMMIDECVSITSVLEVSTITLLAPSGQYQVAGSSSIDITADVLLGPERAINNGLPGYRLARISGIPFYAGRYNYTITGVFGSPVVPLDITRAAVRLCIHWAKQRDTNYAALLTEAGGVRIRYNQDIPDDVVRILESYRRRGYFSRTVYA